MKQFFKLFIIATLLGAYGAQAGEFKPGEPEKPGEHGKPEKGPEHVVTPPVTPSGEAGQGEAAAKKEEEAAKKAAEGGGAIIPVMPGGGEEKPIETITTDVGSILRGGDAEKIKALSADQLTAFINEQISEGKITQLRDLLTFDLYNKLSEDQRNSIEFTLGKSENEAAKKLGLDLIAGESEEVKQAKNPATVAESLKSITPEVFEKLTPEQQADVAVAWVNSDNPDAQNRAAETVADKEQQLDEFTNEKTPLTPERVAAIVKISRFLASVIRLTRFVAIVKLPFQAMLKLTHGLDKYIHTAVSAVKSRIGTQGLTTDPITWIKAQEAELQKELKNPELDTAGRIAVWTAGRLAESLFPLIGIMWLGETIGRTALISNLDAIGTVFSKAYRLRKEAEKTYAAYPELSDKMSKNQLVDFSNKKIAEFGATANEEVKKISDFKTIRIGIDRERNTYAFEADPEAPEVKSMYAKYEIPADTSPEAAYTKISTEEHNIYLSRVKKFLDAKGLTKNSNIEKLIKNAHLGEYAWQKPQVSFPADMAPEDKEAVQKELRRMNLEWGAIDTNIENVLPTPQIIEKNKAYDKLINILRKLQKDRNNNLVIMKGAVEYQRFLGNIDNDQAVEDKILGKKTA